MLLCPICAKEFNLISILFRHIKINHSFVTRFSCKQSGCGRTFQNIYNLKRHFQLKHKCDTSDSVSDLTLHTITEQNPNADRIIPNCTNTSVRNNSDEQEEFSAKFQNCLSQNSMLFISKLYGNYSFPRNVVQDILLDISELLKKPIDILKNKLSSCNREDTENKEIIVKLDLLT